MGKRPSPEGGKGIGPPARDTWGRFLPGNPGGPGRPRTAATRLRTWLRSGDGDETALAGMVRDVLAEAKAGDRAAIRLILDGCLGELEH